MASNFEKFISGLEADFAKIIADAKTRQVLPFEMNKKETFFQIVCLTDLERSEGRKVEEISK